MKSKILTLSLLILLIFNFLCAFAQKETRVLQTENAQTARALIIGISKYAQLPIHNQLDYADDDALAFEKFLLSRPDLISKENIVTLINEDATDKNLIGNTLYNLLNESKKDDLVIVYFSGHGDIQNVLGEDKGFLLLHQVDESDYYTSDALRINEIHDLLTTAASKKEVKILLITDACHSGKILSGEKAKDKVLSALTTEWGNIYKLVSCQPSESSYESVKWGKGHGVFSYYLIYALKGLADKSNDNQLKFGEIASYIYNKVTEETNWKQNPDAKGPKGNVLIDVLQHQKDEALAEFKSDTTEGSNYTMKGLGNYFSGIPRDLSFLMNNFQESLSKNIILPSDTAIYASMKDTEEAKVTKKDYYTIYNKNARAACISNNGRLIAIGGKSNQLKILDSHSKKQLMVFNCEGVLALEFSKDDRYLISGDWFNKTTVWDIEKKKKLIEIKNDNDIRAIAFNSAGNLAAAAGNGNYIKIYNTSNWKEVASLKKHHNGIVRSLAFYENDNKLISGAEDNQLIVRNIVNNSIASQKNLGSDITDIELTIDNKQIFIATSKGNIFVFDYESFNQIKKYSKTVEGIEAIEISDNGDYLFVAGKQRKLVIINNKKQQEIFQTYIPRGASDLDFNPTHEKLIFPMYGGKLGTFDLENTKSFINGYALGFYNELRNEKISGYLQNRIDGYFVSQLIRQSKSILDFYINGNGQKPSKKDFNRATECLKKALSIANKDSYTSSKINFTLDLLKIFRPVNENNINDLRKSEDALRKLIKKYPDATFTYNTLSSIFRKQNLLDSAENNAVFSSKRLPEWPEPKVNVGKAKVAKGEYLAAIDEFNKIIDLQPNNSKGYKFLADLHSFLGNYQEAEKLFKKTLQLNQADAWVYQRLAILKIRNNQIAEAKQLLNKSTQINPDDYRANFLKAKLLHYEYVLSPLARKQSKFTEITDNLHDALSIFIELMENHPNCEGLYTEVSSLFFAIDMHKDKHINIEKIESLIDAKKSILNISVKNYLAISKNYAQKAIKKNPFDAKAYYLLAKYHFARGDKKNTNEAIDNIYKSIDNKALANFYIGKLYYEEGDFSNARQKLEASLTKDPYFVPAAYLHFKTFKGKPKKNRFGEKLKDILQFNNMKKNKSFKDLEKTNKILKDKVNNFKSTQHQYVEFFYDVFY